LRQAIFMRTILALFFSTFISLCVCGQNNQQLNTKVAPDTVLFNNGKVISTRILDTNGSKITIEKPKSSGHKKIELDKENVFSIRYGSNGKEIVEYIYDTLTSHDFTVDEARLFIAGEQDARRGYRPTWTSLIGFAFGATIGFEGGPGDFFFVFIPSLAYTGVLSYPRIHIRHKSVTNLSNVKHDPYLYGYDNVARGRRTIRSLIWGCAGVIVGVALHAIFIKPS
jgi:hypothetical protein